MKIKRVKTERDVKGGQFYIRAVVNCLGEHSVDVFRIVGKAFNSNNEFMKGYRKMRTEGRYNYESFTDDLGVGCKDSALFEYSSKVHNYLLSLTNREFNDVVNQTQLSDFEWALQVYEWETERHMYNEF